MITQMKRWLQKLFAWWPWREEPVPTYAPMERHFNTGASAEPFPRPSIDGAIPQSGIAPRTGNQSEPRCSTIQDWRDADPAAAASPPPGSNNDWKRESPQSTSLTENGGEKQPASGEIIPPPRPPAQLPSPVSPVSPIPTSAPVQAEAPAPRPTAEQHLEFLRYLVQRGIVNEGFTAGDTPEQYRNK